MSGRRHETSGQSGFTLIELLLVVLILAIFTGIALPKLITFGENDLERSARRLAGTVRYLYNEAALTGLEHRLVFNLDDNSYRGLVLNRDGRLAPLRGAGAGGPLFGDSRLLSVSQPGRGSFSRGEVTTALLPGGWLEDTRIVLGDGRRKLYLRLAPLTGMVEISEEDREPARP